MILYGLDLDTLEIITNISVLLLMIFQKIILFALSLDTLEKIANIFVPILIFFYGIISFRTNKLLEASINRGSEFTSTWANDFFNISRDYNYNISFLQTKLNKFLESKGNDDNSTSDVSIIMNKENGTLHIIKRIENILNSYLNEDEEEKKLIEYIKKNIQDTQSLIYTFFGKLYYATKNSEEMIKDLISKFREDFEEHLVSFNRYSMKLHEKLLKIK